MFGGWDINKLVEGATALVSDAQHDIASWDRREDATDASTSAELEEAGANEWNFDAISGITDAFKLDASRIPSLSAYLTSTEESAPPDVIPETGHIPGSGEDSAVTEVQEPVIQAASQAVSPDVPLSPASTGGSSGGKGRAEGQSSKRLSRGSSGSQLGAKKLIRAPSKTLQGASSLIHALPAPSEIAACPDVCLEPPSEPKAAAEHTAGMVPNGPVALAAQQVDLGSSQEQSPPSAALNSAEHQHSPARATASAYSASGIGKSREESTSAAAPLRPATVAEGIDRHIDAQPGMHAAGSVHVEFPQESEPASGGTAGSEDACPPRPTVSPTEALNAARDRSPAIHAPHSEQRSPSDSSTPSENSSLLSPTDTHTSANGVIPSPEESVAEQRPALNGTTASVVENLMPEPHSPAHENGATAQLISPSTESAPVSSPQPATAAADGGGKASRASIQPSEGKPVEVSAVEADQLDRLQEALAVRERQLERKAAEVSEVQAICDQLQRKNEELAQRVSVVSEADLDAVRAEFETRLAASDRKVYALSKERDALRRGNEKLATLTDLLKEKDAIISQVMEEGERLSKKQAQLEGNCKKLRTAAKEAAAQKSALEEFLAHEQSSNASTQLQLEQDNAALQAAQEAHSSEMQQAKHHYEGLLAHSRSSQVAAEQKAASTAQEGTAKRLKEADLRCESLEESLEELRVSMDRQRATCEMREERLKREVTELERRGEEAELRHEELSAKLPAATRPLLRQMEAMQASAAAADGAWAAAERHLTSRVADAEAQAAAAAEKERMAVDRLQAAQSRLFSVSAALDAERAEAAVLAVELDAERQRSSVTSRAAARAEEHMRTSAASAALLRDQLKQAAGKAALELAAQQSAAELRLASAEDRVAELLTRVHAFEATAPSTEPRPPVMPGPGHKWILVKEGQPAAVPVLSDQRQASIALQPRAEPAYLAGAGLEGGGGSAPQLARLQEVLRHRDDQLASLQDQMRQLESTRDSLAEELVAAAQAADSAQAAIEATAAAEAQAQGAQQRLAACEELLGERDERLDEMRADLEDVRSLYKDQFLELLNELDRARLSDSSAAARQSPTTATFREPNDLTIA